MATITIKGLPDQLYKRLKKRAEEEHRSINRQVIVILEQDLARHTVNVKEWLEETARLRKRWKLKPITMEEIDAAKKKGRP